MLGIAACCKACIISLQAHMLSDVMHCTDCIHLLCRLWRPSQRSSSLSMPDYFSNFAGQPVNCCFDATVFLACDNHINPKSVCCVVTVQVQGLMRIR